MLYIYLSWFQKVLSDSPDHDGLDLYLFEGWLLDHEVDPKLDMQCFDQEIEKTIL